MLRSGPYDQVSRTQQENLRNLAKNYGATLRSIVGSCLFLRLWSSFNHKDRRASLSRLGCDWPNSVRIAAAFLSMNKSALLSTILTCLRAELSASLQAARGTIAAATDGDSKAENKYDTRNLEASYLARGQSFRVAELRSAVEAFEALEVRLPATGKVAGLGSLVRLQTPSEEIYYFIGPAAGGTEVKHEQQEVLVTTPSSPLGEQLIGRKAGAIFELRAGWKVTVRSVE